MNNFDCAFVDREVKCTNKTEMKDGLQYTNKIPLLLGDIIIYAPEDLVMN